MYFQLDSIIRILLYYRSYFYHLSISVSSCILMYFRVSWRCQQLDLACISLIRVQCLMSFLSGKIYIL